MRVEPSRSTLTSFQMPTEGMYKKMKTQSTTLRLLVIAGMAALIVLLLVACGGGGGY